MKKWLGIGVAVVTGVAVLYYATFSQAGHECEACVAYDGREACATARAGNQADAMRTALTTACATVTSGVTATLRCQAQTPLTLGCTTP